MKGVDFSISQPTSFDVFFIFEIVEPLFLLVGKTTITVVIGEEARSNIMLDHISGTPISLRSPAISHLLPLVVLAQDVLFPLGKLFFVIDNRVDADIECSRERSCVSSSLLEIGEGNKRPFFVVI
jgi:hypothetical protein